MPIERIRYLPLREKITDAVSAAQCIQEDRKSVV